MNPRALPWPEPSFRTVEISDPRFEAGGIRHATVQSAALGQRADALFHVPQRAKESPDVPLVVLLHGVYGSHWSWAFSGGAALTAARMQAAGSLHACVLAMPSDGLWGDGSGYIPHRGRDFERWIASEVPALARIAAPCVTERSPVFLAGFSMGGFGALRIGAKYPQCFAAVSAHSAITRIDQLAPYVDRQPAAFSVSDADHCVLETMLRNHGNLPPLRFDCGLDDPLLEANRSLHRGLEQAGIPHFYQEFPGGHEWPYWEEHLDETLRFFSGRMADAPVRARPGNTDSK
jgi:S-formylglutathione hydrolase FrmB